MVRRRACIVFILYLYTCFGVLSFSGNPATIDSDSHTFHISSIPLLWNFTASHVLSTPVVADLDLDGNLDVLFGCINGSIYALNALDGSLKWHVSYDTIPESSPALGDIDDDGLLEVVIGSGDSLLALNGEDGSFLWSFTTGSFVISSPAIADINNDGFLDVVTGSWDHTVHVLNGYDGSIIWSSDIGEKVFSSPAVYDVNDDGYLDIVVGGEFYGSPYPGTVRALSGIDGVPLWQTTTNNTVASSPAVGTIISDNSISVVATSFYTTYLLAGDDGEIVWSVDGDYGRASPALGDIDGDGEIDIVLPRIALRASDGSVLWSSDLEGDDYASPSLGDMDGDLDLDVVVSMSYDGVYALEGDTGSVIWKYGLEDYLTSSPVLFDLDGDSKLEVCIGTATGLIVLDPPDSGVRVFWQGLSGTSDFTRSKSLNDVDRDLDRLSGYTENLLGTNSSNPDSDGDSLSDCEEYVTYRTNPLLRDSDNDELSDDQEVQVYFTDPLSQDTDSDTMPDGWEITHSLNPLIDDSMLDFDGDGLSNLQEYLIGTSPDNPDTDNDGIPDEWEFNHEYNPLDPYVPPIEVIMYNPFPFLILIGTLSVVVVTYPIVRRHTRALRTKLESETIMREKEMIHRLSPEGDSLDDD